MIVYIYKESRFMCSQKVESKLKLSENDLRRNTIESCKNKNN